MTFKPAFTVLAVMLPLLVVGCGFNPQPAEGDGFYRNEEQGYFPTEQSTNNVRPVEGFEPAPLIAAPRMVVDDPQDLAPKKRPGRGGLGNLSGYSLRMITDALNQHGEGERASWYEDEHQYQMRIDSHQYVRNARYCKDVMMLKKRNNQHSEWGRHFVTFCRAKQNSPWKLMY